MGHWNHRVMQHQEHLAVHEVFYDDAGEPELFGAYPAIVAGDSVEELRGVCTNLLKAFDKPVLVYGDPIRPVGAPDAPVPMPDLPMPGLVE